MTSVRQPTACVFCTETCGVLVETEGSRITHVRGDRHHPSSRGYVCEKSAQLGRYQHHRDRLDTPLKRSPSGRLEPIGWDTAVAEIAERIVAIRDTHGGCALAFYGGAGQGNHLALPWSAGFRLAMRTPYMYHALGQERTGEFWLDGKLFGDQTCHTSRDIENSDFVVLSGQNAWQAHGFPRARVVLRHIAKDPSRTLVVLDPRRTETADLADVHLQVRPGTDAFVFAAMLATIVNEGLENRVFLEARAVGFGAVKARIADFDVDACAHVAGVDPDAIRRVARGFATANSACVRSDLGLEQSRHSTLNLYLEKLLYLLTGQFGKKGGVTFHAQTIPLIQNSDPADPAFESLKTRVTGMFPIAGFYPPNILPAEIDADHPGRVRGLFVDSGNPLVSVADTHACRRAFEKLDLLVVVDKDLTETAEAAHYVLPASSQFEKFECAFYNWGFPQNHLHLRHPVLPPMDGTLPEQEIYRRLTVAMGEDYSTNPLLGPISQIMAMPAFQAMPPATRLATAPLMMASMMFVQKHEAAVRRAGIVDQGGGLAAALFERIVSSPSGAVISVHEYEDTFSFITHEDGRIHLAIDTMFEALEDLREELRAGGPPRDPGYPYVLSAGERRSSNATANFRDPACRGGDRGGVLRVHPADAAHLGIAEGDLVVCESRAGAVTAPAHLDPRMLEGHLSLPNGFGLRYTGEDGTRVAHGPLVNMLSSSDDCDPLAKTPYHKNIPVRLRRVAS